MFLKSQEEWTSIANANQQIKDSVVKNAIDAGGGNLKFKFQVKNSE